MLSYWCQHAWIGGAVATGVLLECEGGVLTSVARAPSPPRGAEVLCGLTLPGFADAHSHAFHRALRGTVQRDRGTFWTWRETMYEVAAALDPDTYLALARAAYAEMALAGVTCVGEFHYLHHGPDGRRYSDPNAMGAALVEAAAEAGVRLTLLDTAYLSSGPTPDGAGVPPEGVQLRFSDGSAAAWAERAEALAGSLATSATVRCGAAVHSVRAVPARELATVAEWARRSSAPLHVHLSEQPAENTACVEAYGRTPARLLADHGVLGPLTTAVHATHLTPEDIGLLGGTRTGACFCPTTERDLADGIGPAPRLAAEGVRLSLGTDSHARVDLLAEARSLELDQRLATGVRGHFTAAELLDAATSAGHAALGWPDAGALEPGRLADFTTVALDTVRTAGPPAETAAETAVFAATAADVRHTVVAGRHVVRDGVHLRVGDVGGALAAAVGAVTP
ncbi:formimidoylglutamate deiminase [Streptomyces xiaopingdaonensis]|uniref:formimidoylglutamate deiminase n=1 Tax=Streptomyces xiaopingdaonensis TaxID=1565415 RepID=UPI00030C514F|nr:formimidoylglutamate deiminase [Streptomyces xiaopingdaonensis]